jgi:hypothetical protein
MKKLQTLILTAFSAFLLIYLTALKRRGNLLLIQSHFPFHAGGKDESGISEFTFDRGFGPCWGDSQFGRAAGERRRGRSP